jgi:hypothetical protein
LNGIFNKKISFITEEAKQIHRRLSATNNDEGIYVALEK